MTQEQELQAEATLQPILAPLYGSTMSRVVAELAQAQPEERVVILGADTKWRGGWDSTDGDGVQLIEGEDGAPDPLPIIDFLHWTNTEALRRSLERGWDVLIGFPPQGDRTGSDLQEFGSTLSSTAREGARAFLFVVAGLVGRNDGSIREVLTRTGVVRTLVFPAGRERGARRGGLPTHAPTAVVHMLPSPAGASGGNSTRILQIDAGTGESAEFAAELTPAERWTFTGLDPEREQRIQRWARAGDACPLPEVAKLLRPDAEPQHAGKILAPRCITAHGINLDAEPEEHQRRQHDRRVVALTEGDIVGRTIGDPQWALVSTEDIGDGLAAGPDVNVIRSHNVDPRYLLAFLQSDAAAMQLERLAMAGPIPRIVRSTLNELLVPMLPVASDALRESDPVHELRAVSAQLTDDLESRYRSAFDRPNAAAVATALTEAAGDASMAARLLRSVSDPRDRARAFLPHPLARTLRVLQNHQRAESDIDVYQDLLRFGETAIVLLGAVGLAYSTNQARVALNNEWAQGFERGGVPYGTWLNCANAGAELARRAGEPLGGFADALATNSRLNKVLQQFLNERNEHAHGAGPRSPYEYQQRTLELEEVLTAAIDHLGALARSDWFIVESLAWSEEGSFTVRGRTLKGDHPDFDIWAEERQHPLVSGVVYVRLGELDLPLKGFCMLRSCPRCLHEEMYYPDKLKGSVVRLRSLDRGHQIDASLDEANIPYVAE